MAQGRVVVRTIVFIIAFVVCARAEAHSFHENHAAHKTSLRDSVAVPRIDLSQINTTRSQVHGISPTRHSRRFSRPHKLVDLARSKNIQSTSANEDCSSVADVSSEPVSSHTLPSDHIQRSLPIVHPSERIFNSHKARLIGGGEPDESEQVESDTHTMVDATDATNTSNDAPIPGSGTKESNTNTSFSHAPHTTITIHPTLHYNLSAYTEPIKPYLSWLLQYASDVYESKQAQQNANVVKEVTYNTTTTTSSSRVKWSLFRKFRHNSNHAKSTSSTDDTSTDAQTATTNDSPTGTEYDTVDTTTVDAITTDSTDSTELSNEQEHHYLSTAHYTLPQLHTYVKILRSVVSLREQLIVELVARLESLEQELGGMRAMQECSVTNAPNGGVEKSSIVNEALDDSNMAGGEDNSNITANTTAAPCTIEFSTTPDTAYRTTNNFTHTATNSATDTYDLLHGVLKTLHSISVIMDTVPLHSTTVENADNTTDVTAPLPNISITTDTTGDTNSRFSITTSPTTHTAPTILTTTPVPRTVYPSILDEVLHERRQHELYTQRMHDMAAVSSVLLHTIAARIQSSELSQIHIDALTNRTTALEYELQQASLQLCQLRSQRYQLPKSTV